MLDTILWMIYAMYLLVIATGILAAGYVVGVLGQFVFWCLDPDRTLPTWIRSRDHPGSKANESYIQMQKG